MIRSLLPNRSCIPRNAGHNAGRRAKPGRKPQTLDINQFAASVLEAVTGEPAAPQPPEPEQPPKDPAAVALGRKGGLKGGKARAAKMTADERSAAAKKAAKARWGVGED